MSRSLSLLESRLALLFALIFPVLALSGCVEPPCGEEPCTGDDDDAVADDDDAEWSATLHIVVPYGWTAYHIKVDGEIG